MKKIFTEGLDDVQIIEMWVTTNTGAGTKHYLGDILTEIRGIQGVITVTLDADRTTKLGPKHRKNWLTVKFENTIYLDLITLGKQIKAVPGVVTIDMATVDGQKFSRNLAKLDYKTAKSKAAIQLAKARKIGENKKLLQNIIKEVLKDL